MAICVLALLNVSCKNQSSIFASSLSNDGQGGAMIAYEVDRSGGDEDIRMQRVGTDGKVLWDKIVFSSKNIRSSLVGIKSNVESEFLLHWRVQTPSNSGEERLESNIVAKINNEGRILWQKEINKKGIQAISDGLGGAIIVWPDNNGWYIQHLDTESNNTWEKQIKGNGQFVNIVTDKQGGAILLWDNRENPYFVVQRLGSTGEMLWGEGIRIKYLETGLEQIPQIVSNGAGGAIISWAEPTGKGQSSYVWISGINANGRVNWSVPIRNLASLINVDTRITFSNNGDAVVVWEDHRDGFSIYAQKIGSDGQVAWLKDGIPISSKLPQVSPKFDVISNIENRTVIAWIDGDRNLYVQQLDNFGNGQWGNQGILVAAGVCYLPVMLTESNNGIIISWSAGKEIYHPEQSYIQKIDSNGNFMWDSKGVRIGP